jgi:hypothetical protein
MRRPSPTEKVDRRGTLSLPVTRKRAPRPFAVSGCLGIRPLSSALPLPPPFATFCPLLPHHLGPMVGCPGACCTGCKIGWAFPLMHIPYGPQSAHSPLHFYALCAVVRTFPLYLLPCSPLLSIQSEHKLPHHIYCLPKCHVGAAGCAQWCTRPTPIICALAVCAYRRHHLDSCVIFACSRRMHPLFPMPPLAQTNDCSVHLPIMRGT